MTTTDVLVVDDHPIVAQGIRTLLEADEVTGVAAAETVSESIELARSLQPSVVLLDIRFGGQPVPVGDAVARLREVAPSSVIMLFTADAHHKDVRLGLEAGAVACLDKNIAPEQIQAAIRSAIRGDISGPIWSKQRAAQPSQLLTPREHEILQHVARGETNAAIAHRLGLSANTVKTYWQTALRKMEARNRAEAISRAHELGLI